VFEVDEDEGGPGDLGDSSRADGDVFEGFPAFGQQGEAALAEASKSSVKSTRGAVSVFRPVRFPGSLPELDVPVGRASSSPQVP
jgi:hypothetical protein